MKKINVYIITLLFAAIGFSCSDQSKPKPATRITGQGFELEEVQQGTIGNFGDIRVRFEVPGKIKSLIIKERSFEADLATTPERSYFPLFGISKRIELRKDITLNFKEYINQKISSAGKYVFDIQVIDNEGKPTSTKLIILAREKIKKQAVIELPAVPDDKPTPLNQAKFKLQRTGKGNVEGADEFGITWITVDDINVAIKITKTKNGAAELAPLTNTDYDAISSRVQLNAKLNDTKGAESIVLPTARNAASGTVLAVMNYEKYYVLKINHSTTSLSGAGTTVTLAGEYKY
jgi:hypothetical protein